MTNPLRPWLIAALLLEALPPLAESDWLELVAAAEEEGVIVLLAHQLDKHAGVSEISAGLLSLIKQAAKFNVMEQLSFQSEQKSLFQALNQAGIPFLVMKGAALGNWLYESPSLRPVTDIDLWFADRRTVFALADILRPLGYARAESVGDLLSFEQAFDKDVNGRIIRIDAHWAMFNSAILSTNQSFEAAYAQAMPVTIQDQDVKALGITDALINSIGHRALKHLVGQANTLKWLYDQYLLFNALNATHWQELVNRCNQAGISDLSLDAIEHSQATFKTPIPLSAIAALSTNAKRENIKRGWFQSWASYQWHEMQAVSPHVSVRLKWLVQKLWPNPEAMREGYGSVDPAWKFMLKRIGVGVKRLFGNSQ